MDRAAPLNARGEDPRARSPGGGTSRSLLALLLATAACGLSLARAAPGPGARFAAATAAFEDGDYGSARDTFAELASEGARSPELFFALGNAEYRLGDPGRAALAYRRALFMDPAFREARQNLAFLTRVQDSVEPDLGGGNLAGGLPGNALAGAIAGGLLLAALAAGALFALRKRPPWLVPTSIGAGLLGLSSAAAGWYLAIDRDASRPPADSVVVIGNAAAEARTAPAGRASSVASLAPGSLATVAAARGEWLYIDLPDDQRGWVRASEVERLWPY